MIDNNFCVLPFIHTVMNPYDPSNASLNAIPCCRIDVSDESIHEYSVMNPPDSPKWRALQEDFLQGKKPEVCKYCWIQEDAGRKSHRQNNLDDYEHLIRNKLYLDRKIRFLELMLGNACNLACRSCNSQFSSRLVEIDNYLKKEGIASVDNIRHAYVNWRNLDLQYIDKLKLMGGEPFYLKEALSLMTHLQDTNQLKDLNLHITTNGMIFPDDKWIDILTTTKRVLITISVDAIGNLNDYIRYGSKWDVIRSNFDKWFALIQKNNNIFINVNSVITMLNVNHSLRISKYFKQFNIHAYQDVTSYPSHLCVTNLPVKIKKQVELLVTDDVKNLMYRRDPDLDHFEQFKKINTALDDYHKMSFKDYNPLLNYLIFQNND